MKEKRQIVVARIIMLAFGHVEIEIFIGILEFRKGVETRDQHLYKFTQERI